MAPSPPFAPGKRVRVGDARGVVLAAERVEGGWRYTIWFDGEERPRRVVVRDPGVGRPPSGG
ncbi:MAG TPA: hypothetical protein VLH79_05900 [Chthonomonadales bacterium]|nr:hypothetical protein [Chthonomonadales bacterium]